MAKFTKYIFSNEFINIEDESKWGNSTLMSFRMNMRNLPLLFVVTDLTTRSLTGVYAEVQRSVRDDTGNVSEMKANMLPRPGKHLLNFVNTLNLTNHPQFQLLYKLHHREPLPGCHRLM